MALRFDQATDQTAPAEGMLVSAGFHPLADFAAFGDAEAASVLETGPELLEFSEDIAGKMAGHLMTRPESAPLLEGIDGPVDPGKLHRWLALNATGPYDEAMAGAVRELSRTGDGKATFPGVVVGLPPQMIVGMTAWMQGELLTALGNTLDTGTLSSAGGAWMNQMMLQLNLMLEPYLVEPAGPTGHHGAADYHALADFAGFGPKEQKVLAKTGPLIEAAAGGVIALAYTYLLSRPESAGYFQDEPHLAQRKKTLKAWWIKTATQPKDGNFHDYMSKVADAHVPGGGTHPEVIIPADLTIALMGWVEMRVMAALNTIAGDDDGSYVFGVLGEPEVTARVGTAWMRMLTLQLGILLTPYLSDGRFSE